MHWKKIVSVVSTCAMGIVLLANPMAVFAGEENIPEERAETLATMESGASGYEIYLDFENGNTGNWSGIEPENVEIVSDDSGQGGNVLKMTATEQDQYVLNKDTLPFKNGTVSFRFKTTTDASATTKFGFTFRHSGEEGAEAPAFMRTPTPGVWNLYYPVGAMQESGVELQKDIWYDVEISVMDNTYILKIDGIVAYQTTSDNYSLEEGYVGFKFTDGGKDAKEFFIDDFKAEASFAQRVVDLKFDDNNTGSWKNIDPSNLTIVEDEGNKVLQITCSEHDQYVLNEDAPAIKNGTVSFRFKPTVSTGNPYGFVARHKGTGTGIAVTQTPTQDRWNIFNANTNASSFVNGKSHLEADKWHDIELKVQNGKWTFKVDGETYYDLELSPEQYPQESGYFGFKFINGEQGMKYYIDDFVILNNDEAPEAIYNITPDAGHLTEADLQDKLWYNAPAENWETEALPIGNGSMGGMVFGKVDIEEVQMNEITLWDGGPNSSKYEGYNKEGAWKYADLFEEEYFGEGNQQKLTEYSDQLTGNESAFGAYQNYGSLKIDMTEGVSGYVDVQNYRRELDLSEACNRVRYQIDGVDYEREYYVSNPDDVMVIHMKSSQNDALNFKIYNEIDASESRVSSPNPSKTYKISASDNTITTEGTIVESDIDFASQIKVIAPNANLEAEPEGSISVKNAEEVTVLVSIKSDYINESAQFDDPDNPPDYKDGSNPLDKVEKVMEQAEAKVKNGSDELLKEEHVKDYQEIYNRVSIKLGNSEVNTLPTNELLKASSNSEERNPYIDEMLFKYGRYLLIASSRNDLKLSANLQGLWNNSNTPAWNSDYHYNVNIQMIYWPAYVTNIAETAIPYIEQVAALAVPGETTAKEYHNVDEGFVFHMKTNAFGFTAPGQVFTWGWSPGSSAWTLQNVWEYYEFTKDKEMLENTIYPLLKGNAAFWLNNLKEDPETGDLISVPSYSPEHGPRTVATTFDQELVWQLFTDTITASEELGGVDTEFINELREAKERLNPLEIGADGQIKEWREEDQYSKDENGNPITGAETTHRHVSHLLGLYPGDHITMDTPEYMQAAEKSLELRGDEGTGWAKAHKINLWARTGNAERTYDLLTSFITRSTGDVGGVYDNLFCAHPPYQMDGNEGTTSGIAEMLLQSQSGYIQPLPTLPEQWSSGSFSGLMARNGFEVSAEWQEGKLTAMSITSNNGEECVISYENIDDWNIVNSKGENVSYEVKEEGDRIAFPTEAGETYSIQEKTPVQSQNITMVKPSGQIDATVGTVFEDLHLPETVEVVLDGNEDNTTLLNVTWNEGNYNADVKGTYVLTGELQLVEGIANPEGLSAQIEVNLNDAGIPSDPGDANEDGAKDGGGEQSETAAQTGDTANIAPYATVLLAVIVPLVFFIRKSRRNN